MSRIKTMKLSYCPSVWSPRQLCLDIPIPHRTTTFSDVLDTAVKLLPASVPDDGYSEIDVFASEVDKSDWVITEAWNGLERRVDWTESPAHLQYKWGQYLSQVQFILRPKNQPKPPRRKRTRKRNCSLYRGVKNELWEIRLAEKQLLQFKERELPWSSAVTDDTSVCGCVPVVPMIMHDIHAYAVVLLLLLFFKYVVDH